MRFLSRLAVFVSSAALANAQVCFADNLLAMSGPLGSKPVPFSLGTFGDVDVGGALSGLAWLQDNPSASDRRAEADVDNAELFLQKSDGWLQFFVAAGAYTLPSLGTPYLSVAHTFDKTYGPVPEAFLELVPAPGFSIEAGKLPSLVGNESLFTIENVNVERGLLWNQTSSVSRGLQANYAIGPASFSVSWNDGYDSDRFNWITGLASYTLPGNAGTLTVNGGANLGHTARSDFATPLAQNNSAIVNAGYTVVFGEWTLNPYLQASQTEHDPAVGLPGSGSTAGGALLAIYRANPEWTVGARGEYLSSGGSTNLLYGPESSAGSLTVTPSWQKGVFFARAEASYVALFHAQRGLALGRKAGSDSQARVILETGILL